MNRRDARIVVWARLYGLLADRDEYMTRDRDSRMEATSPRVAVTLSAVDAEAIQDAEEVDRMCGAAVRSLRDRYSAALTGVLGWLDQDRLAAVALALPEARRDQIILADPVWGRAYRTIDHDALREVEVLLEDFDATDRALDDGLRRLGIDVEGFTEDARRVLVGGSP